MDPISVAKNRLSNVFGLDIEELQDDIRLESLILSIHGSDWSESALDLIEDDLMEAMNEDRIKVNNIVTVGDYCAALCEFKIRDENLFNSMTKQWNQSLSPARRIAKGRKVMFLTVAFTVVFCALMLYLKYMQ